LGRKTAKQRKLNQIFWVFGCRSHCRPEWKSKKLGIYAEAESDEHSRSAAHELRGGGKYRSVVLQFSSRLGTKLACGTESMPTTNTQAPLTAAADQSLEYQFISMAGSTRGGLRTLHQETWPRQMVSMLILPDDVLSGQEVPMNPIRRPLQSVWAKGGGGICKLGYLIMHCHVLPRYSSLRRPMPPCPRRRLLAGAFALSDSRRRVTSFSTRRL
jgi:hypothetical protein